MAFELVTYGDLVNAVLEELKLAPSDTAELNRIRRDINMVYLNSVAPAKRWPWLRGNVNIEHKPYFYDGTVACTPDGTTITFSVPPATSKQGYLFAINSFSEVYEIASHTAGSPTATLSSPFTGSLQTAATFKVWTDTVILPVDCRETIEVYHSFFRKPMEGLGLQEFRRRVTESTFSQGRPELYSTYDYVGSEEATRYRVMKIHPALFTNSTTLTVDYVREITALELDDDEPVMPIEDRSVLVYGALERAWKRGRNTEASEQSKRDFQEKLANMMGRVEDSQDSAQITPSSPYLAKKRGRAINKAVSATGSGGGSYTAPSYLKGTTIEGANVTANISVNPGIQIDGVDISVLSSDFNDHITETVDAHDASAISVNPVGGIVSDNVQGALQEIAAAQQAASTAAGISVVPVGNLTADDVQEALEDHQANLDALNSSATDAASITVTPVGNLTATDVQEALEDHQSDLDSLDTSVFALSGSLTTTQGDLDTAETVISSHVASTTAHGATGAVVGTTNTQTLTNKDYDGGTATNTSRLTIPKDSKANLASLTRKEGTLLYATDEDRVYYDDGTSLIRLDPSGDFYQEGKKLRVVAGVLRYASGAWNFLSASNHTYVGASSVSTGTSYCRINFGFTVKNVVSFIAAPDETYVQNGVSVGSSVSLTEADIYFSRTGGYIGGNIFYNGSGWSIDNNNGNIAVASYSAGVLNLTHDEAQLGLATATSRAGYYVPSLGGHTTTTSTVIFSDWTGGVLTTANTQMTFYFMRPRATSMTSAQMGIAGANIWVYGVFEVDP